MFEKHQMCARKLASIMLARHKRGGEVFVIRTLLFGSLNGELVLFYVRLTSSNFHN